MWIPIIFFLKLVLGFCLLSLIAGLIKPVYVLWFLDRMNRLDVLKYYGLPSILIGGLLFLL